MKLTLIQVGSTHDKYLIAGVGEYQNRLRHYTSFEIVEIKDLKNAGLMSEDDLRAKEADLILQKIKLGDFVVLLDLGGKRLSSNDLAGFIGERMVRSTKNLVFVVGGAFGFGQAVYDRADFKLSMSDMTFSHRMIRLLICEQLYRAFTILRGEPYHH